MSICKKAQQIRSKPQDARLIKRLFPKGKEENQSEEKPRMHKHQKESSKCPLEDCGFVIHMGSKSQ